MGKKGEQMAAAATNAPAEDAGADDGGEGAGAATEVMGASLRNPDVHLAWLEPTPAEAELLAALEKEHPGMPGLCVPPPRRLVAPSMPVERPEDQTQPLRILPRQLHLFF